jgi:hypothetical protein
MRCLFLLQCNRCWHFLPTGADVFFRRVLAFSSDGCWHFLPTGKPVGSGFCTFQEPTGLPVGARVVINAKGQLLSSFSRKENHQVQLLEIFLILLT